MFASSTSGISLITDRQSIASECLLKRAKWIHSKASLRLSRFTGAASSTPGIA